MRRLLLVLGVGLLVLGLAGFLADSLGLPVDVLALLDQRASVISMVIGLVGLAVQVRPARPEPRPQLPRVVGLPRLPVRTFVGRSDALRQLAQALESGAGLIAQAIHGLGGIGKSELALQYALTHRDNYEVIWWITADNAGQIRSGLAGLGRALAAATACRDAGGPVPMARLTEEGAIAYAVSWLSGRGCRWLLVFDNVEDPHTLDPYLGRFERGHVLITSRRTSGWDAIGGRIPLPVLPAESAMALLARLTGAADQGSAELAHLAHELGYLPLALVQASGYIAGTPGMSVTQYLHLLAATPMRMYGHPPPGRKDDDRQVIARVWQVTRSTLAARDPRTVELLGLLACYAPDDLPMGVLGGSVEVAEAVALLGSYSMITITRPEPGWPADMSEQPLVSVHRLVQAVVRAELSAGQHRRLRKRAARLLEAVLVADPEDIASWTLYARLLPHIRTVLAADSPGAAQAIRYLAASGDYRTARTWQLDHHAALDARLGSHHPDTLASRQDLATYTGQAGDAATARNEFAALLPIHKRVRGPEHPQVLAIWHALTLWTGQAGDPAAARDGAAALLPICERVLGAEHPDTLTTRHDLAYWTGQAGDPESARNQLIGLLPMRERILGPEHPDVLASRHVLAALLGVLGDTAAARDQFAALARVRERVQGPHHPGTLNARHELARWTGEAGDAGAARDQFAALLPVRERVQGLNHPDTLITRDALAYWDQQSGHGAFPARPAT